MTSSSDQESIRVMIADDHPVLRQGLGVALGGYPEMVLVGEAANGEQAVHLAAETKPDVIIMDMQMPDKDGITAIQEIIRANAAVKILVLSSYPDDTIIVQAIKVGALGYVLKDSTTEQLIEAIHKVNLGEVALHPTAAAKLLQEIKQSKSETSPIVPLTDRELEVLRCLGQGMSNEEIAAELVISVRTVASHVRNILNKLQLANRTQAALYAVQHGIAPKPEL